LPQPFDAAQTALASQYRIQVSPLSAAVAIGEQQAEDTAVGQLDAVLPPGITATLVDATDSGGDATVASDGTRTPLISNRAAWLVLIPNQQVPIMYPPGKSGPSSYTATAALLIDASSGDFLLGAALTN
jgi:hypothetical protein